MTFDYLKLVGAKGEDGSIRQWVNHDGIPASTILHMAEQQIYQTLRIREMLTTASGTLAANAGTIALDPDYRQRYLLMFTGTDKRIIVPKLLDEVEASFSYDSAGNRTTGSPSWYATDESNIVFDVLAMQAYSYRFRYYASLPSLSESNPTNILTSRYPSLLMAACAMKAYEWAKNMPEKNYWTKQLADQIFLANREMDQELAGVEMNMVVENGETDLGQGLI